MSKKTDMVLFKVRIPKNYKHLLLNSLSDFNNIHIKTKEKSPIKSEIESNVQLTKSIKNLRQNLNKLLKSLDITETAFQELKFKPEERIEFIVNDLYELILHTLEEVNFYNNRINELDRYIARARIEQENLSVIKSSYVFLESLHLTRNSLGELEELGFKVFTTFLKNVESLKLLLSSASFPNVYQTDENFPNIYQLEDRTIFYVFYPNDKVTELKQRLSTIHAEEVPILKKYLTIDGINFTRINNELNIIGNTIVKYNREKVNLRDKNLLKFAAINEVVQNLEEYNWAEQQFEEESSDRLIFHFFIPRKDKNEVEQKLIKIFRDQIIIESINVPKHKGTYVEDLRMKDLEENNKIAGDNRETEKTRKNSVDEKEQTDLRDTTPRIMKNFSLIRPFESLTRLYGTPSYSEIDPTPFLAITFTLIFGLMFGDIGHGIVLIISGFIGGIVFRKRGMIRDISWIIFYCGIAAVLWGFVYGEFFGTNVFFGYVLSPLPIPIPIIGWIELHNPLNNIMDLFYLSLFIGVIHINLGWFLQFLNYWKNSKKYLAFTDSLMKILLLTGGTLLIFTYGVNINQWLMYPYPILLVLVPGFLLIILKPFGRLFRVSYLRKESFGALLGEGSIETFETALSVISNVASYIRILALALIHIALMLVIQTLISLIPSPGPITEGMPPLEIVGIVLINLLIIIGYIFGNFIVIILEGTLVFINSIRLSFYEFFSKFYQGSGTEFFPFYLDKDYSLIKFRVDIDRDLISKEIEKEIETSKIKEDVDRAAKYIENQFFQTKKK